LAAMKALDADDRRGLLTFTAYALECAQDAPVGSHSRGWLLDRAGDALELVATVDAAEAGILRRRRLEPLRAGRGVIGDVVPDE
jgi:hypothetical protein